MVPSCGILCHTTCAQLTYLWPHSEIDWKHSCLTLAVHVTAHLRFSQIRAIQVTLRAQCIRWSECGSSFTGCLTSSLLHNGYELLATRCRSWQTIKLPARSRYMQLFKTEVIWIKWVSIRPFFLFPFFPFLPFSSIFSRLEQVPQIQLSSP